MIKDSPVRRTVLVCFVLNGLFAPAVRAEPISIGPAVGVAVPGGSQSENHAAGLWAGLRVTLPWRWGISAAGWLDYQVLLGRTLEGFALAGDMKILALGAGLRYTFDRSAALRPGVELGVGNYRLEQPDLFLERKFGLYGGGLAEQDLGRLWFVALEASYHYTFTDRFLDKAQFFRFGLQLAYRLGG
jgi:hypothetical protein